MENEGNKKGRDILKDKKKSHMGLLFGLHGNQTNCHQQQYETDTCFVSVELG